MKFKLEIDCGNAAFHDAGVSEISKILDCTSKHINNAIRDITDISALNGMRLYDVNGNQVGKIIVSK